ncbi:armadillo/beta-catenin-like repeat [Striga asiatica]|uniref:Armadillo/beta-catenin-like repeat n=1 Tax=Striga asiatica TaxID=4170 RepID=A0A5A7PFQ5_STRAF|nr:armadillo/beta-catenin-like repeat [Striga asiatica]
MRVLGDSWCFCNGGGKSERMKASIFSGKSPAMARINDGGTGFFIHRNLLLTTHANLPSVAAVEAAEIRLHNGLSATLFPHRFFITSSVLDLTMVGLDALDSESGLQPHHLKTCPKPNLELGSTVYLLGHTEQHELAVGEGKVVIATDNLIKLSTGGWSPGSAGFDAHGNLAFVVCDPMKLATSSSPNAARSSSPTWSSSGSSSKRDSQPTQFGIPIPAALQWLGQHWEGNLDELNNKPRLPLMRMISSTDHSCPSFTMRPVFKPATGENENSENNNLPTTPQIQLLDINFPPRAVRKTAALPGGDQNYVRDLADAESTGSADVVGDDEPSSEGEKFLKEKFKSQPWKLMPSPPVEKCEPNRHNTNKHRGDKLNRRETPPIAHTESRNTKNWYNDPCWQTRAPPHFTVSVSPSRPEPTPSLTIPPSSQPQEPSPPGEI